MLCFVLLSKDSKDRVLKAAIPQTDLEHWDHLLPPPAINLEAWTAVSTCNGHFWECTPNPHFFKYQQRGPFHQGSLPPPQFWARQPWASPSCGGMLSPSPSDKHSLKSGNTEGVSLSLLEGEQSHEGTAWSETLLDVGDANEPDPCLGCIWVMAANLASLCFLGPGRVTTVFLNQPEFKNIKFPWAVSCSYKYPSFAIVVSSYCSLYFRIIGNPNSSPRVLSFHK